MQTEAILRFQQHLLLKVSTLKIMTAGSGMAVGKEGMTFLLMRVQMGKSMCPLLKTLAKDLMQDQAIPYLGICTEASYLCTTEMQARPYLFLLYSQ